MSVEVGEDVFLPTARPDGAGAHAQIFSVQGGVVEDGRFGLDGLGVVHAARLVTPGAEAIVLYHGGTGFRMANAGPRTARLAEAFNADVITFDYPQVGATAAARDIPTFEALGPALFDRLETEGWIDGRPVYAYGFSFGGAMAANLAATRPIRGLVIESSADDVVAVARNLVPAFMRPFVRLGVTDAVAGFDYFSAVHAFGGDTLLINGTEDVIVDVDATRDFAQRLDAAGLAIRYVEVEGAGHGEAFYAAAGFHAVRSFLSLPEHGRDFSPLPSPDILP